MWEAVLAASWWWWWLAAPATTAPGPRTCPDDMTLVEGDHARDLQRWCTDVRGKNCWGFFPGLVAAVGPVTPIRVCMDRFEWPNRLGEEPIVMKTFVEAEAICAAHGKRLCTEYEWELACEGPRRRPWPHGWRQRPGRCHNDRRYRQYRARDLESSDPTVRDRETARLWQGAPSGRHPECRSPFGVEDLVGNVEEWVVTSRAAWPYRSSLKGGFWAKPWSGCRGTNESHAPQFRFYEIGFRCCRDPD